MSLIVSEVYDALIEAGATEEKARAAAGAIPFAESLATKDDVAKLEVATKEEMAKLEVATKERFAQFEAATKEEMAKLATKEEMGKLRARFAQFEAATMERFAKLDKDVAVLKLAVFTFEPAVVVLLVKLIFFP